MVEGVGSGSYSSSFANLIVIRQIPGLQPKMSKRNKQVVENRTRPDLVERIFAQRARHSKITANNKELSGRSEGARGEGELDAEEENDQARRREAEMKELADQQGETAHTRSLLPKLTNLPSGSSMPHSQPAAAAKRHVGSAISYIEFTHSATSGRYGLRVEQ